LSTDVASQSYACTATNGAGLSASETVTVSRDATDPSIAYTGNAGTYTVDKMVAISCSASDAMSGLQSNSCAPIAGAAYGFAIGANTFTASATDRAGNAATATASFTVSVTHASLCTLVERWVTQAGVANSLCVKLRNAERSGARGSDALKPFVNEVQAQSGKHVPADKAGILVQLAGSL
jgi:hypothetical protein